MFSKHANKDDSAVCIYHSKDLDGHCCGGIIAWLQWMRCLDKIKNMPGLVFIEFIGLDYGDEFDIEQLTDRNVIVLDFSIQPYSDFQRLFKIAKNVLWVDHHKSAIELWSNDPDQPSNVVAVLPGESEKIAACELLWQHLCPSYAIPEAVFYISDYDCWRHSSPETMPFQYGARELDLDPSQVSSRELWNRILTSPSTVTTIIENGKIILSYQQKVNERTAKAACIAVRFHGKNWLAVNQYGVNSKFFDSVWHDTYDGMLAFAFTQQGWKITLYSTTVDCSEIARENGGGGHAGAAGFLCDELPFSLQKGSIHPT
jgi:oligoribonuclease NrnB/cAMP/cGMP phosphodiesterase (DHH superfamily)